MPETLFIINPNAAGGRIRKVWKQLEPLIRGWIPENLHMVMTHDVEDVQNALEQAGQEAVKRVFSIGGDGTNNFMINALMQHRAAHPDFDVIYGYIPAGTGRDFARGAGLPMKTVEAAEYLLTQAKPHSIDVGQATINEKTHYFLNVSNGGIAYDVVERVERSRKRPWSFLVAVLSSLVRYQPQAIEIELDGEEWFKGRAYVVAVANGQFTGQGIHIAPDAVLDDGLFDVIVAEEMATWTLIRAFPTIYSGQHVHLPQVKIGRAQQVTITSPTGERIGLDLDGEPEAGAQQLSYTILPGALRMLL